jgi:hypothetical protein
MIKGLKDGMANMPEFIREQFSSAKSAIPEELKNRIEQQLRCKELKDPEFAKILEKFSKGSFEKSPLKDVFNSKIVKPNLKQVELLKQVKPKAEVLGKVANLLKHIK